MMADHLALMDHGKILQIGTPQDCYRNPVSLAAARLLGPVNAVEVTIKDEIATSDLGRLNAPGLADGPGLALIRPEAVRAGVDQTGTLSAVVRSCRFAGADCWVALEVEGLKGLVLNTRIEAALCPAIGDQRSIALDPRAYTIVPA
jgi:iron(III) transport system ATP-binding protein